MQLRIAVPFALAAACWMSACKSDDTSVIDTTYTTGNPHIASLALQSDSLDTATLPPPGGAGQDSVLVPVTVRVALTQDTPPASIVATRVSVYSPYGGTIVQSTLGNDGVWPDAVAGDSIFTAHIYLPIVRFQTGDYQVNVQITNRDANIDTRAATVHIRNSANHPPVLISIDAPDTVEVPASGFINVYLFTSHVTDPDGLGDIASVTTDVLNTSGAHTGSYDLFDDGDVAVHGDSIANDGIFSRLFRTDSTTTPATFNTFVFYAVDRSGLISDSIRKVIYTR